MIKKLLTVACLAAAMMTTARATVVLPDIMSDNMVLQQSTTVNLWGKAAPSSKVTVTLSWDDSEYSCKAGKDGAWIIGVPTPEAGFEPQQITISDKDGSVELSNVLIGEVWLCSGQSNMEMPLAGFWDCPIENSMEIIAESGRYPAIRVANVPKTPALEPQEETPGKWQVSNPNDAAWFTAVGYTFAKMLYTVLDVPVGIISCSWGGASVEGWSSRETLADYPDVDVDATFKDYEQPEYGWQWPYYLPMIMYNGMLHPLRHYTIKGFLWYQGESNVGKHATYAERLGRMVAEWRGLWGQGDIPFYMAELAPYIYGGDGTSGARLRESQHKAAATIPNSGIVCTNDLVYPYEYDQIHPAQKEEVGQRFAYLALNKTYGYNGLMCEGPSYKEMEISGGEVTLSFNNCDYGLSPWHDIAGFEVAGEDRVFHPAEARVICGVNKIVVSSEEVPAPVAVRYCFQDFLIGSVTGQYNFPLTPFRTDDWD